MANIAGQGEFYKWLYPQLVQQNQFATQLAHEDMTNAAQAAFQAQQQQQRQAAAMQMQQASLQQQAAIENMRQNRMFQQQGILDAQREQRQAAMQQFMLDRDAQQQFARQQYDIGHQALLLDRRSQLEQQQAALEDTKLWESKFSNPFADHGKAVAEAQKNGLTWGQGVQEEAANAQKDIRQILQNVQAGNYNFADVKPQFKQAYARMMQAVPTERAETEQERASKSRFELPDANGNMIPYFVDSQGKTVKIERQEEKGPELDPNQKLKVEILKSWQDGVNKQAQARWSKELDAHMLRPDLIPMPDHLAIQRDIIATTPPPDFGDMGEFSGVGKFSIPQNPGQTIMPDGGQPAPESVQSRAARETDPLYKLAVTAQEVAKSGNVLNTPPQLDQQFSQSLVQLRQANPNTIDDQAMTAFKTLREWEVRKGGELVNAMKSGNPGAERHLTAILTQIAAGRPFQQWSPEDQQEYVLFRSELDAYLRSQGRLTAKTE